MKKLISILLVVALVLGLAGCGKETTNQKSSTEQATEMNQEETTNSEASGEQIVLKIGATTSPDGHYVKGLEEFKANVEEYSNNQVKVEIFPNSQLGNERDLVESVSLGFVEMAIVSTGPLANFVPDFAVFDLPFIVSDRQKAYEVMDGEVGQEILSLLEPKGIKALGFWENGFRNITNDNGPIVHPEDVKGMKIRTMENAIHMATFETLGANPTPMAWSEVFTALQQGVIDGQENPLVIIDTAKVYEVQSHVSLTGHFYSPAILMINNDLFNGFPEDIQQAILKAEKEARDWERNYSIELDEKTAEVLTEKALR